MLGLMTEKPSSQRIVINDLWLADLPAVLDGATVVDVVELTTKHERQGLASFFTSII
jgi:hypothetical protein